ncbi:hypothetical protein EI94DRAFT_1047234 [Lactarius quietus]|nr:hypothetical protein EI94DRAFT_1047234 [Lactarius quietus]
MKESRVGHENGIKAFEACKSIETTAWSRSSSTSRAHFRADSQSKSIVVSTATVEEIREQDNWFGGEVEN